MPADMGLAGILGTAYAIAGGLDAQTALALAVPFGILGTKGILNLLSGNILTVFQVIGGMMPALGIGTGDYVERYENQRRCTDH